MSMNIGPMLRALLGDSVPTDGRALELRVGQIVRGVLLQMLENGEALMNIGGVPVRAKLEADLPAGRGTLLQVQPSGSSGTIVLKPLSEGGEAVPDDSLRNLLKSSDLPEQKWAFDLLRGLKRDGYSVGKETASHLRTAFALKPPAEEAADWMAAAGVAFRRGLPPSEATIASLKQALFGPPLHEEWAGFAAALRGWAGDGSEKSPQAAALAARLQALLADGETLLAQEEARLLGASAGQQQSGGGAAAAPALPGANGRLASGGLSAPPESGMARPAETGASDAAGLAAAAQAKNSASAARTAPASGAAPQAEIPAGPAEARSPASPVSASAAFPAKDAEAGDSAPRAVGQQHASAAESGVKPDSAPSRGEPAWIGRFLQWLGVGHEHRLLGAAAEARQTENTAVLAGGAQQPQGEEPAAAANPRQTADNLKSALLALASYEETPPALREAAHALANQITGQQLLLSPERQSNQPFSMMTLFVPMKSPDGDTTAAVHVQTRRSRKGQWDTNNCRLLFDLRMPRLGETIVDVQVVNRIVSVKLMNDFPGMAELADQAREELAAGLAAAGFQLLSLAAMPLPVREAAEDQPADAKEKAVPFISDASAYAAKPYKGVDFRI